MDPLEQSHIALRGDVDSMKNQLDQLVEAMIVLAKKEDNIQQTAVVENVMLATVNGLTQPQLVQTPIDNSTVLYCSDRKTSSTLAIVRLICFYFCICSFFVVKSCLCLNIVVFNGNIDEVMMHVLN